MITPVVSVGGTKTSYSFKRSRQSGLTLVELMVALVISMLISLAAVSALVVSRQGFNTLDVTSQLRDNGRFVSDLVQRLGVQTGYKDIFYATRRPCHWQRRRPTTGFSLSGMDTLWRIK